MYYIHTYIIIYLQLCRLQIYIIYIYIFLDVYIYYQHLVSQDESNFDKHFDELGSPGILSTPTY